MASPAERALGVAPPAPPALKPWDRPTGELEDLLEAIAARYPRAPAEIDGLEVGTHVANLSSIDAALVEFTELPGIRMLPFADFDGIDSVYHPRDRESLDRCRALAEKIAESGRIDPLIIVVDDKGPYILEGAHRFVALIMRGKSAFPAVVVTDDEALLELLARQTPAAEISPTPPTPSRHIP